MYIYMTVIETNNQINATRVKCNTINTNLCNTYIIYITYMYNAKLDNVYVYLLI